MTRLTGPLPLPWPSYSDLSTAKATLQPAHYRQTLTIVTMQRLKALPVFAMLGTAVFVLLGTAIAVRVHFSSHDELDQGTDEVLSPRLKF